jgi:putative transposase
MGRARRIHVRDGIYYVRLQANVGHGLVRDAEDAAKLSHYAAKAADLCDVLIHAFSWRQTRADLLMQVADLPLGYAVQLISGPFAQYAQVRRGHSGPLFRRYRAALVASDIQLLQIVRYIHQLPVREKAAQTPREYPHHSHHDYAGTRQFFPWLKTSYVRELLARRIGRGRETYARWMAEPVSEKLAQLFERTEGRLPTNTERAPQASEISSARKVALSVEDLQSIIEVVARALKVTSEQILSPSRASAATLARALIAWHALRAGKGTLTDIGRCLERDSSVLNRAIESHKAQRPDLFMKSLRELAGESTRAQKQNGMPRSR